MRAGAPAGQPYEKEILRCWRASREGPSGSHGKRLKETAALAPHTHFARNYRGFRQSPLARLAIPQGYKRMAKHIGKTSIPAGPVAI